MVQNCPGQVCGQGQAAPSWPLPWGELTQSSVTAHYNFAPRVTAESVKKPALSAPLPTLCALHLQCRNPGMWQWIPQTPAHCRVCGILDHIFSVSMLHSPRNAISPSLGEIHSIAITWECILDELPQSPKKGQERPGDCQILPSVGQVFPLTPWGIPVGRDSKKICWEGLLSLNFLTSYGLTRA